MTSKFNRELVLEEFLESCISKDDSGDSSSSDYQVMKSAKQIVKSKKVDRRNIYKSRKYRKMGSLICPECKELLGAEIVHMPKQIKTSFEFKFEEFGIKFGSNSIIHDWSEIPNFPENVYDYYRLADYMVDFGVKYLSLIDCFKELSDRDHKILAANCLEQMIMLYKVWTSSQEGIFYNIKDSKGVLKPVPISAAANFGGSDRYARHIGTIMAFPVRWRWDKKLMSILFAIIYYNPLLKPLSNKEKVWQIQNIFFSYLKDYLSSIYSDKVDIELAFLVVTQLLGKIEKSAEDITKILKSVPEVTNLFSPFIADLMMYK